MSGDNLDEALKELEDMMNSINDNMSEADDETLVVGLALAHKVHDIMVKNIKRIIREQNDREVRRRVSQPTQDAG